MIDEPAPLTKHHHVSWANQLYIAIHVFLNVPCFLFFFPMANCRVWPGLFQFFSAWSVVLSECYRSGVQPEFQRQVDTCTVNGFPTRSKSFWSVSWDTWWHLVTPGWWSGWLAWDMRRVETLKWLNYVQLMTVIVCEPSRNSGFSVEHRNFRQIC